MASTSGGSACDLCGKVCANATGLANHRDKAPCRRAAASQRAGPSQTTLPVPRSVPTPLQAPVASGSLPDELRQLRRFNRLLKRIPKAARHAVAESLIEHAEACVSRNDVPSWTRLLLFSYGAFSLPAVAENRKVSLATMVKKNLTREADFLEERPSTFKKSSKKPGPKIEEAVMQKLIGGSVSGAMRILSSEEAVSPPSPEVFEVLKTKHPPACADTDFPPEPAPGDQPAVAVTAEEILEAINSFPHDSAGGIDGLRP
jgi:hypothetical protein